MRIIFYDLKNNCFLLKTYDNIVNYIKIKGSKDEHLLRSALLNEDVQILNYVPENHSNERIKNHVTYIYNNIPMGKIYDFTDISQIKDNDVFFAWYYYPSHMKFLSKIKCKKVVMGQHFIRLPFNTDLSSMGVNWFVNQIDISNNDFIIKYFNLKCVENVILPYIYEKRFKYTNSFTNRKKKALSMGTISTVNGKDYDIYLEYMKTACLQPVRKMIYEKGNNEYIDVYNNYLFTMGYNNLLNKQSTLTEYIRGKIRDWKEQGQSRYYTFDMVEKYNEYMMCVCGEEIVGLPGIGFVECMACGCAYMGIDHYMYRSLGMIPQVHYIAYDGTYNDLICKIQYYQNHVETLTEIAENGMKFVHEHFNEETVMNEFFNKLRGLVTENEETKSIYNGC